MSKWQWCLEDDNKALVTGWAKVGDYWYYLKNNGAMATGWIYDKDKWYYLDSTGRMLIGWQNIDSKDYCFANDGTLYVSCTTPDGYNVDSKGIWQKYILSDSGADFIGSWEGFWDRAQYDPYYPNDKRYITIGYGTTYSAMHNAFNSDNPLSTTCTIEQAREWLEEEAQECAKAIKNDLDSKGVSLNQNELDALISFAYNCGTGALLGSTLYKNIVAGVKDADTLKANFQAWSKANGQTSQGLLKRRNSEADLFLNADYTGNN